MEIILISNNLVENNLTYHDRENIEKKKLTRPLSISGEELAKSLSLEDYLIDACAIFSSYASSSLGTAKYLAERIDKNIIVEEKLNDAKVGELNNKPLKMIRFMQNHDFNIKLTNGESLAEVSDRIDSAIKKILTLYQRKVVVFTHKRTILGYLIKYGKSGYNLDDNLIVEYKDSVVYNEEEKDVDIIKLSFENKKLVGIEVIDY